MRGFFIYLSLSHFLNGGGLHGGGGEFKSIISTSGFIYVTAVGSPPPPYFPRKLLQVSS